MLAIRHADERGLADLGWLNSRHTFSFGHFHDPKYMGFGPLRVINEDVVKPGKGFDTHGHKDMEIISYVLQGALEHKDSMGTGSVIRPGDVQRMSAGSGIRHSEFNASSNELVHFLQIWILPEQANLAPSYEQKTFSNFEKKDRLKLVGSRDGRDGSITIHQDVDLYASLLSGQQQVSHTVAEDRICWLHVASGTAKMNDQQLSAGDGVAITTPGEVVLTGCSECELLLFDMTK